MLKVRLATICGTRAWLRIYWGNTECPNCLGGGKPGYHNAQIHLGDTHQKDAWGYLGELEDYVKDSRWPTKCDHCGMVAPPNAVKQIFRKRLYDTPSGELEPGCLFWADWYDCKERGKCHWGWTNCDGLHLMAVCPNGHEWDIDGRASNCTLPDDTTHRCWVRTGTPPIITVGKGGITCSAGAGSIMAGDYHGFLQDGYFT